MKKVLIFVGVIVVLFAGLAFVQKYQNDKASEGNPYNKDDLHTETIKQLDDPNYQNQILPEQLREKLSNREDLFVYFYSPTCPHCQKATPKVVKVAKELGVDVYKFNLLEFEEGWDTYGIPGTPILAAISNGQEISRFSGDATEDEFRQFFTDMIAQQKADE
ncbi:thioredoxin family protein [Niallia taxi]|uniref:thioredoxin family protein n=1 Tax=Niallia taxi TaxID=2499688 RepID=UPI0015F69BC9|nr:thioredoxin family protein [Niallia taxi]